MPEVGPFRRRLRVAICGVAVLLIAAVFTTSNRSRASEAARSVASDDLQVWISKNAVAVRSIDASDDDFSDLEPLVDAIGRAQVVQLGEPGHGAGSSFSAKVRLIKFLHERMGFDVLIWESGLHGMRWADAGFRGAAEPVAAADRGVFTIWSHAKEVKPLLEYASASQSSLRPLEMAGFDMQFTARNSFEHLAEDLRRFVGALRESAIRLRSQAFVEQALGAYSQLRASTDN